MKAHLALAFALISLAACSESTVPSQQLVTVAPLSAKDVGYILSGSSYEKVVSFLEQNNKAKVRVLSQKHKLYEIYGSNQQELTTAFPNSHIEKNQFIENQSRNVWKTLNNTFELQAEGFDLEKCYKNPGDFQLTAEATLPVEFEGQMNLGQEIQFHALINDEEPNSEDTNTYAWAILPPLGSTHKNRVNIDSSLDYKPDATGKYEIGLIAVTKDEKCQMWFSSFAVTDNQEFKNVKSDLKADLTQYPHLNKIQAQEAWNKTTGEGVKIAVIDSGVNYNHPAINSNIAVNHQEIPNNGKDDDNNGLVDDYVGYDFSNLDGHAFDDTGHGSHVAGLAAANSFGVAKDAKVLPIKALTPLGGDIATLAAAIYYATDMNSQIINLSVGGHDKPSEYFLKAMKYAEDKNVLVVAAAGNGDPILGLGMNNDVIPHYPSSLPNKNIISVAAIDSAAEDSDSRLTIYSNYGEKSVDIAAPGGDDEVKLRSLAHNNPMGHKSLLMSGTSMATPLVSGVAALVMAKNPGYSAQQTKSAVLKAGIELPHLKGFVKTEMTVNALFAVSYSSLKKD